MRLQKTSNTTFLGVLVLILFYVFLIALILGFSREILVNRVSINPASSVMIIVIIIFLSLFLIGSMVFIVIKLVKERTRKLPGSRLKTRLILLFAFVILLSLIPQSILSVYFINLSINFWFKFSIVDVLEGGNKIGLKYYTDKVANLTEFSKSPLLPELLDDVTSRPERVWRNLHSLYPELSFLQVFDSGGQEISVQGEHIEGRVREIVTGVGDRALSNVDLDVKDLKIIRRQISVILSGEVYYLIFGVALDNQFSEFSENVSSSLRRFKQYDDYKSLFSISVIIFYVVFTVPIFLVAMLISFLLTGEIIRPIVHLEEATRRVAEGDFSFKILTRANDELSLLVNSFNKMVSELASSRKKLLHAEKIAAWQEIARRLAHEIKNPLTPIKLAAERLQKKYNAQSGNFQQVLESSTSAIIEEVNNLTNMLREFSDFAKLPRPFPELVDLKEILNEVAAIYASLSRTVRIDMHRLGEGIRVKVDKNQIKQVFGNLFKNAMEAMPDGGEIYISGDVVKKMNVTYYRIQFRDTGTGIDEVLRENIFDPYFTTKNKGTGLGLAIVESIVFDHNGNIWFESKPGAGTTFFIDLPMG